MLASNGPGYRNNFAILQETIGSQLLPSFNSFILLIDRALIGITNFAESHKSLVKFATTFISLAAGLAVVVGGAIALGGALLVVASFGSTIGTVVAAIAGIGLAIAGVVAAVLTWAPQLFASGVHLVETLAEGIAAGAMAPVHAIEGVMRRVREYLSLFPARVGPLSDLTGFELWKRWPNGLAWTCHQGDTERCCLDRRCWGDGNARRCSGRRDHNQNRYADNGSGRRHQRCGAEKAIRRPRRVSSVDKFITNFPIERGGKL